MIVLFPAAKLTRYHLKDIIYDTVCSIVLGSFSCLFIFFLYISVASISFSRFRKYPTACNNIKKPKRFEKEKRKVDFGCFFFFNWITIVFLVKVDLFCVFVCDLQFFLGEKMSYSRILLVLLVSLTLVAIETRQHRDRRKNHFI